MDPDGSSRQYLIDGLNRDVPFYKGVYISVSICRTEI